MLNLAFTLAVNERDTSQLERLYYDN